jgi:type II secretory pathway component GspD/PulD (secretin)
MNSIKYKQFAVIFMLFGLGLYTFGGTPYVSAHGDGVVKRVQLDDPPAFIEKTPEQLGRENPRPNYERGLPTLDVSDKAGPAATAKSDSLATPPAVDPISLAAGRKIDYVALGQPVDQVMRELGQAVGLRVVVGSGISGTVRKRHFKGEFAPLMDRLSQEYNVFWFADGGVVYVDGLDDQKTKVVKLKNIGKEQIYEAMDQAGMGRAKARVVVAAGEGNARVTGPESFQKAIEGLLASLEPAEDPDIKIIKYGTKIN